MKSRTIFAFLSIAVCLAAPRPVRAAEPPVRKTLEELRSAVKSAVKSAGEAEFLLATSDDASTEDIESCWKNRPGEFLAAQRAVAQFESNFQIHPSAKGTSRVWSKNERTAPELAESAKDFMTGPGGEVSPSSGELLMAVTDMDLSARAGLGFAFRRTYSSFQQTDFGLGTGWECNWTPRLVFAKEQDGAPSRCDVRLGGRSFSFVRNGDAWTPPIDVFLELEVGDDAVSVLSPERVRWAFEKSAETPNGWRLRSIATRHDDWTANRLEVSYLPDCDRIREVVDPFGRRIRFAYDEEGRIVQIAAPFFAVDYRYDPKTGLLRETETSPVSTAVDRLPSTVKQFYRYERTESGWRLCGVETSTRPGLTTEYKFDEAGRVSACTETAGGTSRTWAFRYGNRETAVNGPFPVPETVYRFGNAPHPSLPDSVEMPARKAASRYEWTPSLLLARETDPVGVTTVREYDSGNAKPFLRGNLLAERTIPSGNRPSDWSEVGTETDYVPETALPSTVRHYQIDNDGQKAVLKTEKWEYSADGDPTFHDDGGLVHRVVYNRFGLPALEKDGNENVSVHYYGESFPTAIDFAFQKGSPANGGPEVRLIEDADWGTLFAEGKAIGLKSIFRTKHDNRLPAATNETQTAWTPWGDIIRQKCGRSERLFVRNAWGMTLAESELGHSLTVTEFRPGGEPEAVFHLFDPPAGLPFRGGMISGFSGRFYKESFRYDPFLALAGSSPTDEPGFDGKIASFSYERLPSGKMSAIVNSAGIRREDDYDGKTGWLVSQRIVGRGKSAVLHRILGYHPNGEVQAWEDSFGGVWTNLLDGFGEVATVVHPNGVEETHHKDGLGRETSERFVLGGKLLSGSDFEYDPDNGLLLLKKEWTDDDPAGPRFLVTEERRYDGNGNVVAKRGAKTGSWRYFLFDGLDREVAVRSPSGDVQSTVYREGLPVFVQSAFHGEQAQKPIENGTLSVYDAFGRLAKSIPAGKDENAAPTPWTVYTDRQTVYSYDAAGRRKSERQHELTEVRTTFDTLGNAVKTETIPLHAIHGEKPMVTRTEFLPDGRILKTSVENDALGLFGNRDDASPKLVRADQTTENEYDELGRLVATINPDGLKTERIYNDRSLPERMVWTHVDEPGTILRDLRFRYTAEGLVESVVDGLTGKEIARYGYDPLGRCISARDTTGDSEVAIRKTFNGRGDLASETVLLDGAVFPGLAIARDYAAGIETRTWTGLDLDSSEFWTSEKLSFDSSDRLATIDLDDEGAVVWSHVGHLPETRSVFSANCEWSYSPLLETRSIRFYGAADGLVRYEYGPQGQTWFSSVEFPAGAADRDGYEFASYDDSDDFRRHVAQNSERQLPKKDTLLRRKTLLGGESGSLAAKKASRFLYDQAGNTTVRYGGTETPFERLSRTENDPQYVSPASLIAGDGSIIGEVAKRELASNRETTHASCDGEGGLVAESRTYDRLGNVIAFQGTYWDGERRYPVDWTNRWDALGRLEGMEATLREDAFQSKKGDFLAELRFRYDAANRRVEKTVIDKIVKDKPRTTTERTLYFGNEQKLVFRKENGKNTLVGEYLWGERERELFLATLRPVDVEDHFSKTPVRYYFQQDVGMNVVRVLKEDNGISTVSTASYLGFGENATYVPIRGIRSSMSPVQASRAFDGDLDDGNAQWSSRGSDFLALDLESAEDLSELVVWTSDSFPKDFRVYVVESGDDLPVSRSGNARWEDAHGNRLVAFVQDGIHADASGKRAKKTGSIALPYHISLGGMHGGRVVLIWDVFGRDVAVREFEVLKTPSNPAPIAFAGQWLDRETGLYYQINRYREAGSEKFLSPDPLGFLAGPNLYAYANDNPLEWHDPDGRWVNILIGAGLGALFNGGWYAISTWLNGEEFSWREFAIQVAVGAVAGAVAGATFGACLPAGAGFWGFVGAGAASGGVGGFVQGSMNTGLHGGSFVDSMASGAKGAVVGAVAGAVGGGVVKGMSMPKNISLFGRPLSQGARGFLTAGVSGFSAGGAGGATGGLMTGLETGDYSGIGTGFVKGALAGAVTGIAVHGTLAGVERARGITWDKNRSSYWKDEARRHPDRWSPENLARMRHGAAPQRLNPETGRVESMELHHNGIPRRAGLSRLLTDQRGNLKQVWPDEHRAIDPFRR